MAGNMISRKKTSLSSRVALPHLVSLICGFLICKKKCENTGPSWVVLRIR